MEYESNKVTRRGVKIDVWVRQTGEHVKNYKIKRMLENPRFFSPTEVDEINQEFSFELSLLQMNCQTWEVSVRTTQNFGRNGLPLGSAGESGDFSPIYPNSLMDILASSLCNPSKK